MNTTRRGFLKAAGVTTLLGAVPAMGAAQEADQVWDASFDVVVMGFGFAGASAAVNAAEAGADVLLIDKAPLDMEGGNSRYCAQLCLSIRPEDREDAITYYKNLRGRYDDQSDEVIEAIVDGLSMNRQWLVDHGMPEEDIISMPFPEYPEFEGAQAATAILYKGSWLSQLYQFMHPLALATPGVTFWPACAAVGLVQEGENRAGTGASSWSTMASPTASRRATAWSWHSAASRTTSRCSRTLCSSRVPMPRARTSTPATA